MKLYLCLFLVIATFSLTKAQSLPYLNASSGNAGEFIIDADSNIYLFHGSVIKKLDKNFNPIWLNNYTNVSFKNLLLSKNKSIYFIATHAANANGLIGKLNANGSMNWCKEGISPSQMLLDRNNNLILTSPVNQGNSGITLLVKIDTLGNLIKERQIEASGYLMAKQSVIISDSAGVYTVCSWGNDFEGPVNAVLYKYSDITDSIIQAILIPISYMGNMGQYYVRSVGISKSKCQADAFYITQSTSAANQYFNCTFYVNKYNNTGKIWGIQFPTSGFPYIDGVSNIDEDQIKDTYATFTSVNINTNKCMAWVIKTDSNGISDNKKSSLTQYYSTMSSVDTIVKLMHHYDNNYFCSIEPTASLSSPLTIVKMDSTIGSYCTPSTSISITSTSFGNFGYNSTTTLTSTSSITLTPVTSSVTSVLNYSIIVNSCLALGTKNSDLQNTFSLYPNPTKDILNINTKANLWINQVILFDINGKQVVSGKNETIIDVSKLDSGIYFIKVKTDQGEFSRKFIKE